MKLLALSDLHNEISQFDPIQTDADVVVLSGDIGKKEEGVKWAENAFDGKRVIYVPGNHEFYQGERPQILRKMKQLSGNSDSKVHVLDNDEIIIGDVRFLGCTLWTDFELFGASDLPHAIIEGKRYLNDFRLIKEFGMESFTPEHSIQLHKASLRWLQDRLDEDFEGKTVVVTHHLPSMLSVSKRYKDSLLSACFASNLDHLFGEKVSLWIHGHTHDSIDYVANGTRVICNPRGYVTYRGAENFDFNPRLIVEI